MNFKQWLAEFDTGQDFESPFSPPSLGRGQSSLMPNIQHQGLEPDEPRTPPEEPHQTGSSPRQELNRLAHAAVKHLGLKHSKIQEVAPSEQRSGWSKQATTTQKMEATLMGIVPGADEEETRQRILRFFYGMRNMGVQFIRVRFISSEPQGFKVGIRFSYYQ